MEIGTVGSFQNGRGCAFVFERTAIKKVHAQRVHLTVATQGVYENNQIRKRRPDEKPETPQRATKVVVELEQRGDNSIVTAWAVTS